MKSVVLVLSGFLLTASIQANAGHRHANHGVYYDYARVIKVRPVFQTIPQSQTIPHTSRGHQCFQRKQQGQFKGRNGNGRDTVLPTVAGAIVGGVVGNSLGTRRNRGATTAAGVIIGGAIGHQIAQSGNNRQHVHRAHSHHSAYCVSTRGHNVQNHNKGKRHHTNKRIRGYQVTYRYRGEKFTTFTRQHPGTHIELEVNTKPARFR